MENNLEQLLNSLIEKGWFPRWEDKIHSCRYYDEEKKFKADYTRAWIPQVLYRSIRELCSREAGLWQFVCENGMVDMKKNKRPAYRIIESALTDESELEDFLLQNINVDE